MTRAPITVYIVDDDPSVRQALARLVQSAGMRAEVFETVPELVSLTSFLEPACVIADISLPNVSGLELPGLLVRHGHRPPVIFVTAYDTEQNRKVARRIGAASFFHKPIDGQALLDAIAWAVESARKSTDIGVSTQSREKEHCDEKGTDRNGAKISVPAFWLFSFSY